MVNDVDKKAAHRQLQQQDAKRASLGDVQVRGGIGGIANWVDVEQAR
jgi:hypothetical protein